MAGESKKPISRRDFLRTAGGSLVLTMAARPSAAGLSAQALPNDLYWINGIPQNPFYLNDNHHAGIDSLLHLMGQKGLKFYRSSSESLLSGPSGIVSAEDVVLIKVNAQWKYRGATNSDLVRGLVQRILDHPDTFTGEVVIIENGQGRGSLDCNTDSYYGDTSVRANALDESHSFLYLVNSIFHDPRVSAYLLDPIADVFIAADDHQSSGYRRYENISYPCFWTAGGRRVELAKGIWKDGAFGGGLKLINVPVLKHHDEGGSEITASLKHMYGVLTMYDGMGDFRHYGGLGETCGKMMASVARPSLNIVDAIWVSHSSLTGYPESTTFPANQILAGQDPVALDYWAAKYILYPIDHNPRHHPDFGGIQNWLEDSARTINARGGLRDPDKGIAVGSVTRNEAQMNVHSASAGTSLRRVLTLTATSGGTTVPPPGAHSYMADETAVVRAQSEGGHEFTHWSGSAAGAANPLVLVMDADKSLTAHFAEKLMPPLDFAGKRLTNRSLLRTEYINELTWRPNPENASVSGYRLYVLEGGQRSLLAGFGSQVFIHRHRNVQKNRSYAYALTATDANGREGPETTLTIG